MIAAPPHRAEAKAAADIEVRGLPNETQKEVRLEIVAQTKVRAKNKELVARLKPCSLQNAVRKRPFQQSAIRT
jgi:hypothetical protein